jgi:hypothetical protein
MCAREIRLMNELAFDNKAKEEGGDERPPKTRTPAATTQSLTTGLLADLQVSTKQKK